MITIHCGLHKTGSSAIQLALRSSFSADLVAVPVPGQPTTVDLLSSRLSRLPEDGILSDEHVLGTAFDGYSSVTERVALVNTVLSGRRFQLVVYVRPQLRWLESLYTQGIQMGWIEDPEVFVESVTSSPWISWQRLTTHLTDVSNAERVIIRPYTTGVNVVSDFANVIGSRKLAAQAYRGFRVNQSLSPRRAQLIHLALAAGVIDGRDATSLRGTIASMPDLPGIEAESIFPVALQKEIALRYRDEWSKIVQDWPIGSSKSRHDEWDMADEFAVRRYVGLDLSSPALRTELRDLVLGNANRPPDEGKPAGLWRRFRRATTSKAPAREGGV